jgi:diguanylate cyclase (GGDEF)-like protein
MAMKGERSPVSRPNSTLQRRDRSNPLDSPELRAQISGLLLMGAPILGIVAAVAIPGEAAPGVDRINILVSVGAVVLGFLIFQFGRNWRDVAFDVIATTGFAAISGLTVLNLRGPQGVDLTPLYGVVLMVVGLFFSLRRAMIQAALMSILAFGAYWMAEHSLGAAFGHWIIATAWAIVGGAIVAVLRNRLGHTLGSLTVVAETDGLTGLANRAQFLATVENQLGINDVAILILDLDRFKEVNDHFGHRAGDVVLRVVAERLQSLPGVAIAARLGGDEFALALTGDDACDRAKALAPVIIAMVEVPIELGEAAVEVSTSIGMEVVAKHESVETNVALQRADAAMYRAKSEGVGSYMYTPELDADQRRRRLLLADLDAAIHSNEITLCYQPKIHLASGGVVGVEALARWNHPTLGTIPPTEFVGLAEQSGLIDSLTRSVLEVAMTQCRKWLDAGLVLPIAVNVSSRNFADRFALQITELLVKHNVDPALLVLEVTERRFTDDTVQARAVLEELRAFGVQIAIDDFGTGYSSLAHLRVLPVDELKIDRSFVFNMENDAEGALITESAIQLGQNLGLLVVAEGVETAETAACLLDLGCDVAQGYFYCRPLVPYELELWLVERGEWDRLAVTAPVSTRHWRVPTLPVDC